MAHEPVYSSKTYQQLLDENLDSLEDELGYRPNEGDSLHDVAKAISKVQAQNQEQSLEDVSLAAHIRTAHDEQLDFAVEDIGLTRKKAQKATGVIKFSRDSAASQDYTIPSGTAVQTSGSDPITFETTEGVTLASGTTSVKADAKATEGGVEGNLAANTLTVMPSPPSGVDSVTNPSATGDTSLTDTNGDPLIAGEERETDNELRSRALDSTVLGGAATPKSIADRIEQVDGVQSISIFTNNDSTDNTSSGGLPEWSAEFVVYGGANADIANAMYEMTAVTHNLYGGAHGTDTTYNIESSVLTDDTFVARWSRPAEVTIDMSVNVYHTSDYVGDEVIKNKIVDYIGGTLSDGSSTTGERGVGEDVYLPEIESLIVGGETGVKSVQNLSTTPASTTDANGNPIVSIADGEVPTTNASDNSITLNTTQL